MISNNRKFYIYGHYDKNGRLRYIGKGHAKRAWSKESRNNVWSTVFKSYFPKVEFLESGLTETEAFLKEKKLIAKERIKNSRLINICDGGIGGYSGERHPLFGTKRSKETIEKMLLTKEKNNSFAKPWLGKSRPLELMKKMSKASQTFESKEKRYAPRIGVSLSKEHREKIKKSLKKKAVLCSNGQHFESINEAARCLGLSAGRVSEVINGIRKSAKGLSFRFDK